MSTSDEQAEDPVDPAAALVELYDRVLPEVYGYLRRRCGSDAVAEELTSLTFLAAAAAVKGRTEQLSAPWVMTVARNKLVDHWRRQAREERALRLVELPADDEDSLPGGPVEEGPALATLQTLSAPQRAALTLRHLDGLSVPEVADCLGRSVQATDALLSRARTAFRRSYPDQLHRPFHDEHREEER